MKMPETRLQRKSRLAAEHTTFLLTLQQLSVKIDTVEQICDQIYMSMELAVSHLQCVDNSLKKLISKAQTDQVEYLDIVELIELREVELMCHSARELCANSKANAKSLGSRQIRND